MSSRTFSHPPGSPAAGPSIDWIGTSVACPSITDCDGEHAIVVALDVQQRVEIRVLILQRVHELVLHDEADLLRLRAIDHVEHLRRGIVEADDLLGVEIEHERAQIEILGDEAEPPEEDLLRVEIGLRALVLELLHEKIVHLLLGATLQHGLLLEFEPGHLLDLRDRLGDFASRTAPAPRPCRGSGSPS